MSFGSCAMTDMVCDNWVFPQRNSPKTSLMLIVWKPLCQVSILADSAKDMHVPAKNSVELFTSGRDLEDTLTLLPKLMSSLEATTSGLQKG
jgi:hypothetical protein